MAALFVLAPFAYAQNQTVVQTLTVSPTLFDLKAEPGQVWQSEIRVVNVNNYDLVVYPQVVNFAPLDESGRGNLIPIFENETEGTTLAEWVTVPNGPVIVPRQQTKAISVTVAVPNDAAPGGHYAAILVGTKPPTKDDGVGLVQTAQFVTSLLFMRVAGDVNEEGVIREFRTTKAITETPSVGLSMRFENKGNVHLQPQGEIKIYNQWGNERGIIPINHQTHFGNVLPNSIREFQFTWEGDTSAFDIGRYKAVATLGYGDESKQFANSTTYFWVIPYRLLAITLVALLACIWVFSRLIKRYIARMLALQGVYTEGPTSYVPLHQRRAKASPDTVVVGKYKAIATPVRVGVAELNTELLASQSWYEKVKTIWQFILKYRLFFIGCALFVALVIVTVIIVKGIGRDDVSYEITIGNPGTATSLTSEDVTYNAAKSIDPDTTPLPELPYQLDIVNVSGKSGVAAKTRIKLEEAGFATANMESDTNRTEDRTVIVYDPALAESALTISVALGGVLLSASDELSQRGIITVYAGSDIAEGGGE